jgi:hypothetical protein
MNNTEASDKIRELCGEFQASLVPQVKGRTKNIKKEPKQERKGKRVRASPSSTRSVSSLDRLSNLQNQSTGLISDLLE